jgi:hypothetical protein
VDACWTFGYVSARSGVDAGPVVCACCERLLDSNATLVSDLSPSDCSYLLWSLSETAAGGGNKTEVSEASRALLGETADAVKKHVKKLLKRASPGELAPASEAKGGGEIAVAASLEVLADGETVVADAATIIRTAKAMEESGGGEEEEGGGKLGDSLVGKLGGERRAPLVDKETLEPWVAPRETETAAPGIWKGPAFEPHELCTILYSLTSLNRPSSSLIDLAVAQLADFSSLLPYESARAGRAQGRASGAGARAERARERSGRASGASANKVLLHQADARAERAQTGAAALGGRANGASANKVLLLQANVLGASAHKVLLLQTGFVAGAHKVLLLQTGFVAGAHKGLLLQTGSVAAASCSFSFSRSSTNGVLLLQTGFVAAAAIAGSHYLALALA